MIIFVPFLSFCIKSSVEFEGSVCGTAIALHRISYASHADYKMLIATKEWNVRWLAFLLGKYCVK